MSNREKVIAKVSKYIEKYVPENIFMRLEKAVYDNVSEWATSEGVSDESLFSKYKSRMTMLCHHLNPENNDYLQPMLLSGKLSVEDIASMTSESELNPKNWHCEDSKITDARVSQIVNGVQLSTTSLIICYKCGSETIYEEKQTRSCDEAMTVKVLCPKCGKKFFV